jgi:hypothetical protein
LLALLAITWAAPALAPTGPLAAEAVLEPDVCAEVAAVCASAKACFIAAS